MASIAVASSLLFSSIDLPAHAEGNAALEAATKAMLAKKEKSLEDDRNFDSLPDGAKKRRALSMCKEADLRKGAGYNSASACNEAVLSGNYAIGFPINSFKNIDKIQKTSEVSTSSPVKTNAKVVASSIDSTPTKKREKQQDLSDLSPAAKKRRSLAACKKPEIRKFASMGSESKCTNNVLAGEYDRVIEALEYGF